MKLKTIEMQNIHRNIDAVTIPLANLTYLSGKNGDGKTTILQAIQLAMFGYIHGQSKVAKEVFQNATNKNMPMVVQLTLDDDGQEVIITRKWTPKGDKVTASLTISPKDYAYSPQELVGNSELPIFNFNEFLSMTANKTKDWFIDLLAATINDESLDVSKTMREGLNSLDALNSKEYYEALNECIPKVDKCSIQDIRELNEIIKTNLTFYKAELNRFDSTGMTIINDYSATGVVDTAELQTQEYLLTDLIVSGADIDTITATMNKVFNLRTQNLLNEIVSKCIQRKIELEQIVTLLNSWSELTSVNNIQDKLAQKQATEAFCEALDKHLHELFLFDKRQFTSRLNMGQKNNSFSYGVVDNAGRYIPFKLLSCGERCKFAIALFLTVLEFTNPKAKVLMIDDMLDSLDSDNWQLVQSIIGYLAEHSDIQMIIAGIEAPDAKYIKNSDTTNIVFLS